MNVSLAPRRGVDARTARDQPTLKGGAMSSKLVVVVIIATLALGPLGGLTVGFVGLALRG